MGATDTLVNFIHKRDSRIHESQTTTTNQGKRRK